MKEYPRGCHPNSLKALEEHRHKGMYTKKQSEEAAEKSAIMRRILKEAVQYGMIHEDDELWQQLIPKVWESIKDAAMAGDFKAFKIMWRSLF